MRSPRPGGSPGGAGRAARDDLQTSPLAAPQPSGPSSGWDAVLALPASGSGSVQLRGKKTKEAAACEGQWGCFL